MSKGQQTLIVRQLNRHLYLLPQTSELKILKTKIAFPMLLFHKAISKPSAHISLQTALL